MTSLRQSFTLEGRGIVSVQQRQPVFDSHLQQELIKSGAEGV